jgi:subtilisin family serine protease
MTSTWSVRKPIRAGGARGAAAIAIVGGVAIVADAGNLGECVENVGLQPWDARRAAARLVHQPPRDLIAVIARAPERSDDFLGHETMSGGVAVTTVRPRRRCRHSR